MWARVCEFMLGCWLLMSPFIFAQSSVEPRLWVTHLVGSSLVMAFAIASFWSPLHKAHWATLVVALALVAVGRFTTAGTVTPADQNQIIVGLLLLMFAIVPNHASRPAQKWSEG